MTRIKLDGESRDKGKYTFIWNSVGSEATYKLLRYSSAKGKYVTWKTVTDAGENDIVELTTAREYGKYKLKTEMKVDDTNISYSSENTLKLKSKLKKAKKSTSLSVAPSAIAYDKQMEQYYFTASNRIYKMNSKMKSRKTYHRLRWHRSQDVCGYNGVIMSCIWTGGKNSFIDMYRSTDGAYIGSYSIPLGEIESVCVDDGHLVMLYNGGNIYRTKKRLSISKLF